jgi:hypothetical protein
MSSQGLDCRHVRVQLGGDPRSVAPEVAAHLETCADCRRFHQETLALDARLRVALELPIGLLALFVGGGFWLLRPLPALAGQVAEHVRHEPGSWEHVTPVPSSEVAALLSAAGVRFDTSRPVVYATRCPFNGRYVPHLVVQTEEGPLTVMLLADERVSRRREFVEGDLRGVLLPAGNGAVAVLARAGGSLTTAGEIAREVTFR